MNKAMSWIMQAALAGMLIASGLSAAEPPKTAIGLKIEDFSLRDYRGKVHALADYAHSKIVVVTFVGNDCPVAKLFAPRLAKLSQEFGPQGVTFLAINSNCQDLLTAVAAFARVHELEFPVLKDPGNVVADRFGAVRTPEVFVLDEQRVVRYHGRVDDQYLVGLRRSSPTREDLRLAIQEMLAGQAVSVAEAPAVGCHIGRVPERKPGAAAPASAVTYSDQIARLFQARCVSCHREGEIAPFPLTNYKEVVGWGETIREVVQQGRMPPWLANPDYGHFANDARLSDVEKQLIYDWLDAGAVEGDPARLPPPREFTVGWQIPQPDQVFYMRDTPVDVPAEGTVAYQYFSVDPGFKEDRWIQYGRGAAWQPGGGASHHRQLYPARCASESRAARFAGRLCAWHPADPSSGRNGDVRARRLDSCYSNCTTPPTARRSRTAACLASYSPIRPPYASGSTAARLRMRDFRFRREMTITRCARSTASTATRGCSR